MTIPLMLDPPRVVTQSAQTCWAAAFESWSEATTRAAGAGNPISSERLIEMFGRDRHLTRASGRATADGIMVMAAMGLMRTVAFRSRRVTIDVLGRALEQGYVYLIYFRVGHPAHAVVLYGVDAGAIYVMDPWPGRGLTTLPANYFATLSNGRVVMGFPMLGDLASGVSAALAPLLSDGH